MLRALLLAARLAARPRLAARAGARRARAERPPRVTMQSNASGHKVVNIFTFVALLNNNTKLSTELIIEKPAHNGPTMPASIAAARCCIKNNRSRAAPAPCPPCTNRPHRTAPHRTAPHRTAPCRAPPFPPSRARGIRTRASRFQCRFSTIRPPSLIASVRASNRDIHTPKLLTSVVCRNRRSSSSSC